IVFIVLGIIFNDRCSHTLRAKLQWVLARHQEFKQSGVWPSRISLEAFCADHEVNVSMHLIGYFRHTHQTAIHSEDIDLLLAVDFLQLFGEALENLRQIAYSQPCCRSVSA